MAAATIEPRWWSFEPGAGEREKEHAPVGARCGLCFHRCLISQGKMGFCGAREYGENGLASPYLGRFSSCAVDPMEKKPLYHFMPGSFIFSLGSLGCTMRCPFCQNASIAQPKGRVPLSRLGELTPQGLLERVRELGIASVAYTYNEPALQGEYILAAAPMLRDAGIATVMVTNGVWSEELLHALGPWVDAANVDVKSFNEETYRRMGGSLAAVKRTVEGLLRAGVHIELTTLVVPGISDNLDEFAGEIEWIAGLSTDIPLHISRYFPAHKYKEPATSVTLMEKMRDMALTRLRHVYLGNIR